ncbi:4-coumarate--CoA ligase [Sarracenia purpurea var. burkii]
MGVSRGEGAIAITVNPLCTLAETKKQTLDCHLNLAFTLPNCVDKFNVMGVHAIGVPQNVGFNSNQTGVSGSDIAGGAPGGVF